MLTATRNWRQEARNKFSAGVLGGSVVLPYFAFLDSRTVTEFLEYGLAAQQDCKQELEFQEIWDLPATGGPTLRGPKAYWRQDNTLPKTSHS